MIYLDKIEHKNVLYKLYAFFYRIKKIKSIKKANSNSTIISFLEYPNLINLLTRKYGKSIISVRNHMSTKHNKGIKSYLWNLSIKLLYSKADEIVVVSKEIERDLIENYRVDKSKIKVIYNFYPIETIKQLAQMEIEDNYINLFNNPVVITAGRLNKQKGHWHLIKSFSKVKKVIPNAKLVILGEGELEGELKQLIKKLDIKEDVYFLGFQKNPFKYISKSKVFVLSSLYEGFPNALAEAMACGIPVISTDCLSGPREILAPDEVNKSDIEYNLNYNRYGMLLPVCDGNFNLSNLSLTKEEEMMADTIISLLKDKDLRNHFSKQAMIRIKDFDIKNIIKQWESII